MLVVDDLQWADGQTLDALLYVLAGPVERPLGVVLTVRSTDVGPSHPLRRWLADARRLPGVEERTLGPLTRDEVGEELALVLGEPAHTSLVDEVHVRSGGNPYFARLLVDGLDPSSRALPQHLPEALSAAAVRSWGVLSVDARRLVVTLAVGGRPVRGAPLARVADIADLPDPGPALHEAVDAGMLDVADDGAYWFHHPLQAEALEESLLPDQRRALHAGFAVEYAQEAGAELTAELAETVSDHYTRAGRPEEARRWALLAARAMRASGDEVGRLRMLRRCVSYGASLAGPGAAWRETLLEVRDLAEDLADWEAELEAIDALGEELAEDVEEDALTLAVLGARRAILCFITGRGERSGDLARPLALSAFRPGSWQRLYVVAEYVHILTWEGRADLAAAALAEVEALLSAAADGVPVDARERRGEDRARAYGLAAVAMYASLSDAVSGHEAGRVAADAAAACGDGFTLLDAAFWEANSLATRSRAWLEAMEQRRRQMLELRIAHPYVAWLCASQAHTALHLGEVRLCADRLRVALGSDPGPSGDFSARLTAALLAAGQGRQREAEAHLARADEPSREDGRRRPSSTRGSWRRCCCPRVMTRAPWPRHSTGWIPSRSCQRTASGSCPSRHEVWPTSSAEPAMPVRIRARTCAGSTSSGRGSRRSHGTSARSPTSTVPSSTPSTRGTSPRSRGPASRTTHLAAGAQRSTCSRRRSGPGRRRTRRGGRGRRCCGVGTPTDVARLRRCCGGVTGSRCGWRQRRREGRSRRSRGRRVSRWPS